ncbi:MAG: FeS assembly SUF system regulator [Gammaproteobacteria bacterium]|jgi:FeS assembly SUF system regulator
MLRLSKITDYGVLVMTHIATTPAELHSSHEIAEATGLGDATVSKVLKLLTKPGLLASTRGNHGGYRLARLSSQISVAEIVTALEGPIALTECGSHDSQCSVQSGCGVRGHWQLISVAIRDALDGITLEQLTRPATPIQPVQFKQLATS